MGRESKGYEWWGKKLRHMASGADDILGQGVVSLSSDDARLVSLMLIRAAKFEGAAISARDALVRVHENNGMESSDMVQEVVSRVEDALSSGGTNA